MKNLFLLSLILLVVSCSKSGIELVDKAPHIKTGDRIENEQAVYMLRRLDSSEDVNNLIKVLKENYSSDFDWNLFWYQMNQEGVAQKLDHVDLKKITELANLSCPTMALDDYALVYGNKPGHTKILIESLKNQNCLRTLEAKTLSALFKNAQLEFDKILFDIIEKKKITIKNPRPAFKESTDHLSLERVLFLQATDCDKTSAEFYSAVLKRVSEDNIQINTTHWNEFPQCYRTSKVFFPSFLSYVKTQLDTSLRALVACQEKGCLENTSASVLWKAVKEKNNINGRQTLTSLLKIADFKKSKPIINEILTTAIKSIDSFPAIREKLENSQLITDETFREIQDQALAFSYDSQKADQVRRANMTFLKNAAQNLSKSQWFLLYSIYSIEFEKTMALLLEESSSDYVRVLNLSTEAIRENTQAMDRLAVMVGGQLIKDLSKLENLIKKFGLTDALRLIETITTFKLEEVIYQASMRPTDFIQSLSRALQLNLEYLRKNPNLKVETNLLIKAWQDQVLFDQILARVFNKELSLNNTDQLSNLLSYREEALNKFEAVFYQNKDYKSYLAAIDKSLFATILLIRDQMRISLASEERVNFDFDFLQSALNNLEEPKFPSYEKVIYHLTYLYKTLDIDTFDTHKEKYCQLMSSFQKKTLNGDFGPGCFKGDNLKKDTIGSLFGVFSTEGKDLSLNSAEIKGGILDLTNRTAPKRVPSIKATSHDQAYTIPAAIKYTIPHGDGAFSFPDPFDPNQTILPGKTIYLRYFHTKLPETPAMASAPKKGLPSGKATIELGSTLILPKVIAYGSEGEKPALSEEGGTGIEMRYSSYAYQLGIPDESGTNFKNHFDLSDWNQEVFEELFSELFNFLALNNQKLTLDIDILYDGGSYASTYCKEVLKIERDTENDEEYLELCKEEVIFDIEDQFYKLIKGEDLSNNSGTLTLNTKTSTGKNRYFVENLVIPPAPMSEIYEDQGPRGEGKRISINGKEFEGNL